MYVYLRRLLMRSSTRQMLSLPTKAELSTEQALGYFTLSLQAAQTLDLATGQTLGLSTGLAPDLPPGQTLGLSAGQALRVCRQPV